MIRFVFLALALALTAYVVVKVAKQLADGEIDWRGVAAAAGFVFLALYLRHATGIGGLPGLI